jgi:hypothetical protein
LVAISAKAADLPFLAMTTLMAGLATIPFREGLTTIPCLAVMDSTCSLLVLVDQDLATALKSFLVTIPLMEGLVKILWLER